MKHILSVASPNLRGFFVQWLQWQRCGDLQRDDVILHYVWQCLRAPTWAQVQDDLAAVALQAQQQGSTDVASWQIAAQAALKPQWWGLLPGMHRLVLENERLILTITIGQPLDILNDVSGHFGQIELHPGMLQQTDITYWSRIASALKPLCAYGTSLRMQLPITIYNSEQGSALQHSLSSTGWIFKNNDDITSPSALTNKTIATWQAVYAPHWIAHTGNATMPDETNRNAIVIGAGLAGAAVAFSLARRGWNVTIMDAGMEPAAGASGLPVGLIVPHSSADDTRISQVIRAGIRCSLQRASHLLRNSLDWSPSGVLEHCVQGKSKLPRHWPNTKPSIPTENQAVESFSATNDWSHQAALDQIQQAGLTPQTVALWHPCAAWIKPPKLIEALLEHVRIRFIGGTHVSAVTRQNAPADTATPSLWSALDAQGTVLTQAPLLVLAAGFNSRALLQSAARPSSTGENSSTSAPWNIALSPLRGQIAWDWHCEQNDALLPHFPINGKGSMAAHIPYKTPDRTGAIWITGSTFAREDTDPKPRTDDIPSIHAKLNVLHPCAAERLHERFNTMKVQSWAGVRATAPDRLPVVGAVSQDPDLSGLQVCCGLGARGLALAMLCGELLAAKLHHEPLPTTKKLASMLAAARWNK